MGNCGSCGSGAGPFAEGQELVEFVYQAHGGGLRNQPISSEGLQTRCLGCGGDFVLKTFVGKCPHCEGVNAVSPPRCNDAENIQFAGKGYRLPEE